MSETETCSKVPYPHTRHFASMSIWRRHFIAQDLAFLRGKTFNRFLPKNEFQEVLKAENCSTINGIIYQVNGHSFRRNLVRNLGSFLTNCFSWGVQKFLRHARYMLFEFWPRIVSIRLHSDVWGPFKKSELKINLFSW